MRVTPKENVSIMAKTGDDVVIVDLKCRQIWEARVNPYDTERYNVKRKDISMNISGELFKGIFKEAK